MQIKKLRVLRNAIKSFDIFDQKVRHKIVFTTQRDNRVDDAICLPLAGIAFDIDDPLRPVIPDDTHPNCRCYYVDEITGQIITDISSHRDIKERDELTDRQRKKIIKEDKHYLTQKKMDLIVEYMEKNEEWQSKSLDFIPSDDTGLRPLSYKEIIKKPKKTKEDYEWIKKYTQQKKKASLEQIVKWVRSL